MKRVELNQKERKGKKGTGLNFKFTYFGRMQGIITNKRFPKLL